MKILRNKFFQLRNRKSAARLCGAFCVAVILAGAVPAPVVYAQTESRLYEEETSGYDPSIGDEWSEDGHVINPAEAAAHLAQEIQTNTVEDWPQGPAIAAGSAILMDGTTGNILYAKNIHDRMYPASTTKLLTALIAVENLDLDDTVTFSERAVDSVPSDGSTIGMEAGETLSVRECLLGLLVASANECANALAEKVSGTIEAFTDRMNERAQELGCTDSHFANANGLFLTDHYSSAHDLALIGQACFANETLEKLDNTASCTFSPNHANPDGFTVTNLHKLVSGEISYPGIIGGKTGYTNESHRTLVTGCERDGMKLVCVVMDEDDPAQFEDTCTLFDYGFADFSLQNIAEQDTRFRIAEPGFMKSGTDILGSSAPALAIAGTEYADLPSGISFDQLTTTLGKDNMVTWSLGNPGEINIVGRAALVPAGLVRDVQESSAASYRTVSLLGDLQKKKQEESFWEKLPSRYVERGLNGTVYINVMSFLVSILSAAVLAIVIIELVSLIRSYNFSSLSRDRRRRNRRKKESQEQSNYYDHRRWERSDTLDQDHYR